MSVEINFCLEIRGVPTSSSEDTNEIVKNIGSIVDVCIEYKDISISHRIKSGTSAISPIIVKFTRREIHSKPAASVFVLVFTFVQRTNPLTQK